MDTTQLYQLAAKTAAFAESGKSYKTALFTKRNEKIIKRAYYLADKSIKHREIIDDLLSRVGLLDEVKDKLWLARIAIQDLLWGQRRLPKTTPLFRKLVEHRNKFLKVLPTIEKKHNSKESIKIPRYIRINTELLHKDLALAELKDLGFKHLPCSKTYAEFLSTVKELKNNEFIFDFHVPNLLVFNKKAKISELSPVKFIRQDKSSCLVSLLLAPVVGSSILDMCAAPGYKTQHAASVISKMGVIYSADINKERYKTLVSTCKKFNLEGICHPMNIDALKVTSEMCPGVEYIIVDPPCSGTGIVNVLVKHTADVCRLRKLGNLQAMILKHALSNFPSVRRIVYSTCSVEEEENEQVVSECLEVAEKNGFSLVPLSTAFRQSFETGVGDSRSAPFVLRTSPEHDLTNGFFIALFERSVPPVHSCSANLETATKKESTLKKEASPSSVSDVDIEEDNPVINENLRTTGELSKNSIKKFSKKKKKNAKIESFTNENYKSSNVVLSEKTVTNTFANFKPTNTIHLNKKSSVTGKHVPKKSLKQSVNKKLLLKGFKTLKLPLTRKNFSKRKNVS